MKKGALFCLKGFIREPKPTKKGIRVLLGILEYLGELKVNLWDYRGNYREPKRATLLQTYMETTCMIWCN